jgi:plastocyanin
MRRLPLVVALASLGVLATPAAADDATVKIANIDYSPSEVSIHVGEKVTWNWAGPDRNHTVTSDSGQAESYESAPGVPDVAVADGPAGETFSHTFNQTGTFTYHCRVHSSMHGKVNVVAAGAPLPVTPPADTTPPKTKLKLVVQSPVAASRSGRLKVKVTVDEAATEKLAVKLGRKTIARKTVKFSKATTKTVTLRLSRSARRTLADRSRARISVSASATDKAGNKAKTKKTSGTLRAGRKSSPSPSPSPSPYNY